MYKAIQEIGDYKIGDIVPDAQAKLWLSMYSVPPVELISGKVEKPIDKPKSSSVMVNDYLDRNSNVVIRNVETDDLSIEILEQLLVSEASSKNRSRVIKAIKNRIKEVR
jgi:hypothetical protein